MWQCVVLFLYTFIWICIPHPALSTCARNLRCQQAPQNKRKAEASVPPDPHRYQGVAHHPFPDTGALPFLYFCSTFMFLGSINRYAKLYDGKPIDYKVISESAAKSTYGLQERGPALIIQYCQNVLSTNWSVVRRRRV